MRRCGERIELTLDEPKKALPILDNMGFTDYEVVDREHIHVYERMGESAELNRSLVYAGIPVKGISIITEELESYFLNLTGGTGNV